MSVELLVLSLVPDCNVSRSSLNLTYFFIFVSLAPLLSFSLATESDDGTLIHLISRFHFFKRFRSFFLSLITFTSLTSLYQHSRHLVKPSYIHASSPKLCCMNVYVCLYFLFYIAKRAAKEYSCTKIGNNFNALIS